MGSAIKAGATYAAMVFAAGYVYTTFHYFLETVLDPAAAELLNLPVMLAVSWLLCRREIDLCSVGNTAVERLVMGAVASALLMSITASLGMAFAVPIDELLTVYATRLDQWGLAGHVAFGVFPLVQKSLATP